MSKSIELAVLGKPGTHDLHVQHCGKRMICIGESAEIKISSPKLVELVQAVLIHTALTK